MSHDLLRRFLARRNARRFDRLVEGTRARLLLAAYRVTGDLPLAEDVVQEVYVKLLREERDPGSIRSGLGWLVQTTLFHARTALRAAARRRAREAAAAGSRPPAASPVSAVPDPLRFAGIRDAVAALPRDLRGPTELRYFAGLSNREIAETLGLTRRAVDKRLARARDELAPRLAPAALLALEHALLPGAVLPAAAPAALESAALLAAAGVALPGGAARATVAACALLVAAGVTALGIGLWPSNGRAPRRTPATARPQERARAATLPATLVGSLPDRAGASTAGAGDADAARARVAKNGTQTVRVVGPDGELVRRGRMRFWPVGLGERGDAIERVLGENPSLLSWRWLVDGFDLAGHNPLVVPVMPEVLRGTTIRVYLDVRGLYAPETIAVGEDGSLPKEIRLSATGTLEVRIRDAVSGAPLERVQIVAELQGPDEVPQGRDSREPPAPRATTDERGEALVREISPEWRYLLTAREGYHPAHLPIAAAARPITCRLVPLARPARLTVHVFREGGEPWPGAGVVYEGDWTSTATTGPDGRAVFEGLPPGPARVRLGDTERRSLPWTPGPDGSLLPPGVDDDPAAACTTDAWIRLEEGARATCSLGCPPAGTARIVVRVTGPNGEPRRETPVGLGREDGAGRLAATDESGEVVFDALPPGTYDVKAWLEEGGGPVQGMDGMELAQGDEAEVVVRIGERTVVVDREYPARDREEDPSGVVLRAAGGRYQTPARYEGDRAVFSDVPAGRWDVVAMSAHRPDVRVRLDVEADADPDPVTIRLEEGGRVSFRFADESDPASLAGVTARLEREGRDAVRVPLDSAGGFVWTSPRVEAGPWRLVVTRPGVPRLERPVTVENGESSRLEL